MPRSVSFIFAAVALVLLLAVIGQFLRLEKAGVSPAAEDRRELVPTRYSDLPGWSEDDLSQALPALRRSCGRIAALAPEADLGGAGAAGTAADWHPACTALAQVPAGDQAAAKTFFETHLRPVSVRNHHEETGLFTGYYEPLLEGSRKREGPYQVPLYRRPPELVMVDLGQFRDELAGQRIAGEVEDGNLRPYADRAEIEEGALEGRGLEIAWVNDPVDAFFLQIQGSGRIRLAEGGEVRAGYAAQNGHPYFAIGKDLIERGAIPREKISMQSIRRWLEENPEEAVAVMRKNASYVFFEEQKGEGPLGAEGVPLTPGRSLAVDRKHIPLGVPIWLDGAMPGAQEGAADRPLRRLLVAQDTGGAIRGPVRGDVFWGHGEYAADVAGRMKHPGRLWLLLPKTVALPPTSP